ncbi:uncharacterized protein [Rutidosis leptorrhynchoides]|uniref:uncharacterized protein n=1 Tax=Rutidosis leptorrhynchoides TaxID=125765 RepID=UPI003A9972E2
MEEEPTSESQSYSPPFISDVKLVQLPELFQPKLNDTNTAQLDQILDHDVEPDQNPPQPIPDMKFTVESQDLITKLDDPYFFDVFGLVSAEQFLIEQPFLEPVSKKNNRTGDETNKPVSSFFDDFSSEIFRPHRATFRSIRFGELLETKKMLFRVGLEVLTTCFVVLQCLFNLYAILI